MDEKFLQENWSEIEERLRRQWPRLTEEDLDRVRHDWDELAARLQRAYGLRKEHVLKDVEAFRRRLLNGDGAGSN